MTQVRSGMVRFYGHGEKWSRKKDAAIVALVTEPTIADAAKKAGISHATLHKWLKVKEFKDAYMQARREAVSAAISRLQQTATEAVDALRDVMNDTESPASARVSAARSILEIAIKAIELEDLEARVAELELLLQRKGGMR